MILNKDRFISIFALFFVIVFISGCVDIPSSSPAIPDYRASVKYIHFGRGQDTIAFVISKFSYTKLDSVKSVAMNGADTVKTTRYVTTSVVIDRYNRYLVNFGQPITILVDGSSKGILNAGETTAYFDTPAGGRKIELKGNGTYVDSISVTKIDSAIVIRVDTVKSNGTIVKSGRDTTGGTKLINFVPVTSVTSQITIDSSVVTAETDRQLSLFFIGDTIATTIRDNVARYGLIRFTTSVERYLFSPTVNDSALVRFVHVSPLTRNLNVKTRDGGPNVVAALPFTSLSQNRLYKARIDTTYNFYIDTTTTTSSSGIMNFAVTLSKGKQYTIALMDSAGVRTIRTYQH